MKKKVFDDSYSGVKPFKISTTDKKPVNYKDNTQNSENSKVKNRVDKMKIEKIPTKNELESGEYLDNKVDEITEKIVTKVENDIKKEEKTFQFFKETFDNIKKIQNDAEKKGYQDGLKKGQKEGYQKGFNEGRTEGLKKAEQLYKEQFKNLVNSLENITSFKQKTVEEAKFDALELSLLLASKIISQEITMNPATILNIVQKSLETMVIKNSLIIHLNSEDFKLLQKEKIELMGVENVKITIDSSLKRGDFRVETDIETAEISISKNLEKVGNQLRDTI